MTIDIPEGYESLGLAIGEAVAQASRGKGADRHAEKGEPFSSQLICEIPKRLGPGGECFCLGQALKKICESRRLPPERARAELLGAINYLAAAWGLLGGFKDAFGEPESDAPRTKEELMARIRGANPSVYAPEDADAPRFQKGELVEYESIPHGEWVPACYMGVDRDGMHVVATGETRLHLPEERVRKAEKAG